MIGSETTKFVPVILLWKSLLVGLLYNIEHWYNVSESVLHVFTVLYVSDGGMQNAKTGNT